MTHSCSCDIQFIAASYYHRFILASALARSFDVTDTCGPGPFLDHTCSSPEKSNAQMVRARAPAASNEQEVMKANLRLEL